MNCFVSICSRLFFATARGIQYLALLFILHVTFNSHAQTFAWAKQMGGANATSGTSNGQIKIDASGNIYHSISASAAIDVDPGPGVFNFSGNGVVKLGPSGNLIWAKNIPGNYVMDVAGNIYSTGSFSGTLDVDPGPGVFNLTSFGYADIYVLKFDANGNFVWGKQIGGNFVERAGGVVVSSSGNSIIVTGGFGYGGNISEYNSCDFDPDPVTTHILNNVGGYDGFFLTLNSEGQFVSVLQRGTTADDSIGFILIDNNNNFIYTVAGGLMEKADQNYTPLWTVNISNLTWALSPITTDASGNILFSGGYMGTFDIDPGPGVAMVYGVTIGGTLVQAPYVLKFDTNGNFLWVRTLHANGFAGGVTSDASGNVYTMGYFNYGGNVDFDPGAGTYNMKVSAIGGYIQKLTPDGNFIWAVKIGGESRTSTYGRGIGVSSSNEVYSVMDFKGTIDVNPGAAKLNMTSVGNRDILFHKMTQPGSSNQPIWPENENTAENVSIYPVPATNVITIINRDNEVLGDVIVYDMSGKIVLQQVFSGSRATIGLESLRGGTYIIRYGLSGKTTKFIKL